MTSPARTGWFLFPSSHRDLHHAHHQSILRNRDPDVFERARAHKPHFHALYGDYAASIGIETGELFAGKLPRRAARIVRDWARSHRAELDANWKRVRRGELPTPIAPLE